ncbi:uncharacterized protein MELLADRAFT_92863 [Melampsora larici-populina 98AG31]|uniref:Uncharacterized protein n=1 Tax=Melampsora larici-populina (strain 98AG31 / pathotype 3-4-7) TaxID=747676 RepID=F4S320_MELLP|nr:uncharacterized protein MELLADRAFT_92863 [Melampsora larici-populina 98AG31]EGG00900.1 hypothetical protein MELLADRAFT_92863 [Melampsora larici-populina 98AG31]
MFQNYSVTTTTTTTTTTTRTNQQINNNINPSTHQTIMSSMFLPFLRSLLITPQSSNPDPILHVVHQTIRDQDRGGFTTPERQQDHLSYHDTGLRSINGANILLDSLALNPFAQKLTLSHNHLGDLGLQHLVIRSNSNIKELNLASNQITDIGFNTLVNHWLSSNNNNQNQDQTNCDCATSISLNELYLSNNQISLSLQPSPLLYINNLSVLSLTSNPIHGPSLVSLFRNPSFSPKALKTLHLSACALDSTVAFALSGWLEDSNRSGRLEWLAVNGNNWGVIGCERIVWSLAKPGGNKNLLRVEMLACNLPSNQSIDQFGTPIDRPTEQEELETLKQMVEFGTDLERAQARTEIDNDGGWKQLLERCELRNQVFRLAARRAALGVISTARIVLLSKPSSLKTSSKNPNIFHWNKLPEEIQFQIWRWVALLSAFPEDTLNQSLIGIPDPLTTKQLLNVLKYSSNRKTLFQEISCRKKLEVEVKKKSSIGTEGRNGLSVSSHHRQLIETRRFEAESDKTGQEMVLKACDCQRFEGRI